ncbi:MAG: insulinase family protein, partial [Methylococcales bacterium]|nr:insulinase family protein [Methylococcales bacterium]
MTTAISKTKLDNGLTVILKEMHHAPVISSWVWYRVGSRNEIPGITGSAHWVEHMMFKGTELFPPGTLDKAVSREGGRWNAFTWIDFTAYYETMPADRAELGLKIESDRMVNTLMEVDSAETERTVIISERHMNENSPMWLLREEMGAAAFRVHSYHHTIIGDETDLETMTRDDLYSFYKKHYAPNNATVVVVGDFKTAEMLAKVEHYFGELTASEPPA